MFLNALVALVSVFLGAFFAYRFERTQRKKEQNELEVAAGNRALFTLFRMSSALRQYQIEMVEEYRTKDDRWLNFPAGSALPDTPLLFDAKDLSFVLQSTPSAFQFLFLEADRFEIAKRYIEDRNRMIRTEVFPTLSAA